MRKAANGSGTIYKRPDGRWMARVMEGWKENGKKNFKYFYGSSQEEVTKKLEEYKALKHFGFDVEKQYKFAEFADLWFEDHKTEISATTQEGYQYTLRILKRQFGRQYVHKIKSKNITDFLKELREEGWSDSSRAKCRGMLYQIFQFAEANDVIFKNPVEVSKKLRGTGKKGEKDSYTIAEVATLLKKLPKDDKYAHGIILLLGTGMRSQELLALQPRHISEDGTTIFVHQAMKRVKGRAYVGGPKTESSDREIPVARFAIESAKYLKEIQKAFVFEERKKGQPCCYEHFADQYKKHIELAGVRYLSPHCCRHTYISLMQAAGVTFETIQDLAGHSDMKMTRKYLHVQDDIRRKAVDTFSDQFS